MIIRRFLLLFLLGLGAAACSPSDSGNVQNASVAFPTITPGAQLRGIPSTPGARPGDEVLSASTLAAQANRPTPTPDTSACPAAGDSSLVANLPQGEGEFVNAIASYLSAGGSINSLQTSLTDDWGLLGDTGFIRSDADLTNEGSPEIIIGYELEGAGSLLILGCANGRYVVRHQNTSNGTGAPQIIQIEDLNQDSLADLMVVYPVCETDDAEDCEYQTQLLSWQPTLGRITSILSAQVVYRSWPDVIDMDSDGVSELVLSLDNRGDAETGPLRTGVNIYDWNGVVYVLSIVRLDPPRYRIQILHQADQYMEDGQLAQALGLYQRSLDDDTLRAWRNDESTVLQAYGLYRLLITRAALGDPVLVEVIQRINQDFPEGEPVYVQLSQAFWDNYSNLGDIGEACDAVQSIIAQRQEALNLLNRYGDRSPVYNAQQLCPF